MFTDGACAGNPGPGGWCAILRFKTVEKEICGFEKQTTNNQMEMRGVIEALRRLKEPCHVVVHTDSQYLHKGFTIWMKQWKRNGWKTAGKMPVKNRDLWQTLDELAKKHEIEWVWVRGHAGHPENERCDELAREQIVKNAGMSR
ncbi:MAG: ribonuclease HI [Syntrophobacteraceae bacterium]